MDICIVLNLEKVESLPVVEVLPICLDTICLLCARAVCEYMMKSKRC